MPVQLIVTKSLTTFGVSPIPIIAVSGHVLLTAYTTYTASTVINYVFSWWLALTSVTDYLIDIISSPTLAVFWNCLKITFSHSFSFELFPVSAVLYTIYSDLEVLYIRQH